ncbi:putative transposase (plasmid) [Burkholderia glumae BGR1]|nr:putative transposase [Burkholderia glumae BGR1]AJY62321.1 hypothetical protein KS03_5912 [Burkholderia glumae LMG 2196 = ATCC 33617]QKM51879.1 hypothetical protein B7760_05957 [Burkholderia glumae]QKM57539.1 hypothetical protein CG017_05618 [Burkholderia glumae]QTP37148.1 hypothetical protein B7759_05790 [Burkholderia glumae]
MKKSTDAVQPCVDSPISFKGYRFPPAVISYARWLYYRFPLFREGRGKRGRTGSSQRRPENRGMNSPDNTSYQG